MDNEIKTTAEVEEAALRLPAARVVHSDPDRHTVEQDPLPKSLAAKPIDQSRRFIISYFLSDDTILVFEPPVRNSGAVLTQDLPYLLY